MPRNTEGLTGSVKNILKSYFYGSISKGLRYSNGIIITTQILTVSLILLIILQILLANQYSITLLRIQTYISHISATIIYVLIFSATKQVGALLFSLAFLTTSSLISDERVRKSLLISAIGMAILVASIEITPLQYHVYPPYGIITMAFLPLGTYLLFVGIFISAKNISRDAGLRKEFYKRAESQLNLLRAIGISEMEKEIVKQVASLESKITTPEPEPEILSNEKVREIIRDVLNELYYSKQE